MARTKFVHKKKQKKQLQVAVEKKETEVEPSISEEVLEEQEKLLSEKFTAELKQDLLNYAKKSLPTAQPDLNNNSSVLAEHRESITNQLMKLFTVVTGVLLMIGFKSASSVTRMPGLVVNEKGGVKKGEVLARMPPSAFISSKDAMRYFDWLKSTTDALAFLIYSIHWKCFQQMEPEEKGPSFACHRTLYQVVVGMMPPVEIGNVNRAFLSKEEGGFSGYMPEDFKDKIAKQHERFQQFLTAIKFPKMQNELSNDKDKKAQLLTLQWAFSMVNTRAWDFNSESVLVSILDLVNHPAEKANVVLVVDVKKGFSLVALDNFKEGEEPLLDYDPMKNNGDFARHYGFTNCKHALLTYAQLTKQGPRFCLTVFPHSQDEATVNVKELNKWTWEWVKAQSSSQGPSGKLKQKERVKLFRSVRCLSHKDLSAMQIKSKKRVQRCVRCLNAASRNLVAEEWEFCLCTRWSDVLVPKQQSTKSSPFKLVFYSTKHLEVYQNEQLLSLEEVAQNVLQHMHPTLKPNAVLSKNLKYFFSIHLYYIEQRLRQNYSVDVDSDSIEAIYCMVTEDRLTSEQFLSSLFLNEISLLLFWRIIIKLVLGDN